MSAWSCVSCGGENPEAMRFCGHCGSPRESPAAPPPDPTGSVPSAEVASTLRSFVSTQVADRLEESEGLLAEERRLVTAVFADISGFTALAERYDPEELSEVIDPVVGALSDVIAKHGGYVEKFAGDAILALFGAPISHEDDPQRALTAALELHDELARVRETLPYEHDLGLHVGVNSGHGIARVFGSDARMDYAVLGDAVILAQRLESAAPTGETYVGETTYRLTKDGFDFAPVPDLTLKGKPDPVPAWRLLGTLVAPAEATPGTGVEPTMPLVGREHERATALACLDRVFAEVGGGVVAIVGEAGVGKSRLTQELAVEAAQRRATWMEVHCLPHGAALTYFPFAQLLRTFAGIDIELPAQEAAATLVTSLGTIGAADSAAYFLRLLGLPAAADPRGVEHLEPAAYRRGLHEAFAFWLGRLASESPLLIMVEDCHWMDAASRALMQDLLRNPTENRFLLLLTSRPEGEGDLDEIIASAAQHRTERVMLEPLGDAAVDLLLHSLLGAPPPSRFSALVAERAGGNPFFVEELVRALRDEGALVRGEQGWQFANSWEEGSVPLNLEGVLSARIDLLPRAARASLLEASVIGRRVPVQLLAGLSPTSAAGVDILVEKGFLDRVADTPDELQFHHALVQDAAYSRLLRRQRRALHHKVAELVEALYGAGDEVIDLLARHSYLGEIGPKAIDYLVRAGERAARLFANEAAILHLSRGLELARRDPGAEGLADLILSLADLHELIGSYDEAFTLYGEAAKLPDEVRAWRGMASVRRRQGRYADAERIIDEAFASVTADQNTSLWLERAWTLAVEGRTTDTIEAAQAGLLTALPDDPLRPYLLIQLARAQHSQGAEESALANSIQAQHLLEEQHDQRGLATAFRLTAGIHLRLRDVDKAEAALQRGLSVAERVGNVEEMAGCLINLGMVEHQRGNLDAAIDYDRRAIAEFERIGHGSGRAIGYSNLSEKLMDRGDLDDALQSSETALAIARDIDHIPTVADALQMMATIYLRRGEYETAAAHAEQAVQVNLDVDARGYAADAAAVAAEAWTLAGDELRAAAARARVNDLGG